MFAKVPVGQSFIHHGEPVMNRLSQFVRPLVIAGALGASYTSIGYMMIHHMSDPAPKPNAAAVEVKRTFDYLTRPIALDKMNGRSVTLVCSPQ